MSEEDIAFLKQELRTAQKETMRNNQKEYEKNTLDIPTEELDLLIRTDGLI